MRLITIMFVVMVLFSYSAISRYGITIDLFAVWILPIWFLWVLFSHNLKKK